MIPRRTLHEVKEALQRQPAVALLGPRQVGKTTLAQTVAQDYPSLYLDLENNLDREKLSNPERFFQQYEDSLLVLDEIHRIPELFATLRGVIDQGRARGKRTGRFLLLGSASLDLLQQSSESLAGRIAYLSLSPLDVMEATTDPKSLITLWVRGGFPDSFLAASDHDSLLWRRDFIRTYLERDIPMFGPRVPATTLERLWTMLAHNQSTLLNASRLASALAISSQSVTRYIDLLVDLLLVRRLPPYHININKRLTKAPKTYIRDSGLMHGLLNISDFNQLAGHHIIGPSWEGFVIENLLAVAPYRSFASFYRTAAGAEIDLLLEIPNHGLWAIEIKNSPSAKPDKGFYIACEDVQPAHRFVVYPGEDRYPLKENVEVISLKGLMELLIACSVA